MTQESIRSHIETIHQRIAMAAEKSGRDPSEITILGASKQVEITRVLQAISLGIIQIGENQVQEAETKVNAIKQHGQGAIFHMIGHLQANKVKRAVAIFDVIQSVDSIRLAQRIDRSASEVNRHIPIYIQVNIGHQPTKEGVKPDQVLELAEFVAACDHISLAGLMTVPPHISDKGSSPFGLESIRPYFRSLRDIRDNLYKIESYHKVKLELSMGMSDDFDIAVEEGATIIRLGSSIWGPRPT